MSPNPFVDEKSVRSARKDYAEKLSIIAAEGVCPFCKENIRRHHHKQIEETNFWLVTENLFPYTEGKRHLLYICKRHITKIEELTGDEWSELLALCRQSTATDDIRNGGLFVKFGNTTSVKHLHFHLVQDTRIGKAEL